MIEKNFDIPFAAELALREKQIQQNYRPYISIHKWFARRPGTLFRCLLLAEFGQAPLREIYFKNNKLKGIRIADPFMGGGTPLLEANRIGCDVEGYDINPMAYWIVREEIEDIDFQRYRTTTDELMEWLEVKIGNLYRTKCAHCSSNVAQVKYFLWVKVQTCKECSEDIDLFPRYIIAKNRRHPKNVLICPMCGELSEVGNIKNPGKCQSCDEPLSTEGPAKNKRCICPHCKSENHYPNSNLGPPRHRMFAIEYHCSKCKSRHKGRFFKKPDNQDIEKYNKAVDLWNNIKTIFVPDDEIPRGDETDRLHRWGYRSYNEMFNERQLLGLELSAQYINNLTDERIRNALATNLSDLLRYQNLLCRYDTMALKSLDIFSVHGFPIGLVQCESNLFGIYNGSNGKVVGSGGWLNIIEKYIKAKEYCANPFEFSIRGAKKTKILTDREWIGERKNSTESSEKRNVNIKCKSATSVSIPFASLDGVFTDPPYFGNVQYAELIDFCYVWLKRLIDENNTNAFKAPSTRNPDELTGNITMDRSLTHFTKGISDIYSKMAAGLKPGAPLVFTYHHNNIRAYFPIAIGILDAGLVCTTSLPCPAEMSASIHINGTLSSIIDTVFVCRSENSINNNDFSKKPEDIACYVYEDLKQLQDGNVKPTHGDIRCIIRGHLIRIAIWHLKESWDSNKSIKDKLSNIERFVNNVGGLSSVEKCLENIIPTGNGVGPVNNKDEKSIQGGIVT